MYDFVFGAPLPSKAESHASASAFDSCGEYLRTTRPGSAKNSVFFRMASDQTPHSIIQPPVARTSSDTQRFCACKGHPGEPTLLLKTCMAGGSSTRARSSRKSRGRRRGTRTARIGRTPGACLPNLPAHTQTTTWFRHAAQAWTRSGLAWVLAPTQDHGHRGPHRGPVMGERRTTGARAWRSLLALSPVCGHQPRASGLRHTRAPRTSALGIPGRQDASPVGFSDDSTPPPALGPVLDFLRISVPSAVHDPSGKTMTHAKAPRRKGWGSLGPSWRLGAFGLRAALLPLSPSQPCWRSRSEAPPQQGCGHSKAAGACRSPRRCARSGVCRMPPCPPCETLLSPIHHPRHRCSGALPCL